jgi:hypothetical protein
VGTKHAIECVEVERADEQPINATLRECSIETERKVARSLPSLGDEEANWLLLETANDELERNCRGPIQPLDIVNGDHDWTHLRERAKHAENAQRNRSRQRYGPFRLRPQQRDVERATLRRRESRHRLFGHLLQQIPQPSESELRLRFNGPAGEQPIRPPAAGGDRFFPERRLADAHLALQKQTHRARRHSIEEALKAAELSFASND